MNFDNSLITTKIFKFIWKKEKEILIFLNYFFISFKIRNRSRKSPSSRFSVKTSRTKFYVTNEMTTTKTTNLTIPEFNIVPTEKPEPDDRPEAPQLDLQNQRQKNPDPHWPRRPRVRPNTLHKLTKILFRHFSRIRKPLKWFSIIWKRRKHSRQQQKHPGFYTILCKVKIVTNEDI
jgi:hypothetical protein